MSGLTLDGRRVAVIGGATGIGFAIAELAHGLGAEVVIGSRDGARVGAAAARLPGAVGASVDLGDEASVATFFDTLGAFDHLAITAGDGSGNLFQPMRTLDFAKARAGFEVRFWGVILAIRQACTVIAAEGSITLTTGTMAHHPMKGAPLATALHGSTEYLMRGLAIDLAPIRVNVVCPGLVLTDQILRMSDDVRERLVAPQPLPRGASPKEAAQAYVYLMLNGIVTGQSIVVDGGGSLI